MNTTRPFSLQTNSNVKIMNARSNGRYRPVHSRRNGGIHIHMAATKDKKNADLERLTSLLTSSDTFVVAGVNYKGLSVKNMIKFRRELPEGATLMVAKNTLMRKASENTKFATIAACTQGMNAWLFVDENCAPTFKKFRSLAKAWKKEGVEIDFTGAVLDERFLHPGELKPLESLPTKIELIQNIAVALKQVPTKLARGTKQVPSKIAYGVRIIADGGSDIISA
jgi:large subunit ribosomal protein L10